MSSAANHHLWMAEALRAAQNGLYSTHPNPRVGCVIVKDGELHARGWHEYTGGPHAEVNAIAAAPVPEGADFYVTLEPCSHHGRTPPCVDAIIAARPARVIAAMQDPNPEVGGRGLERLRDSGIEVVCGVMETEARALNAGFVKRMQRGLPLVTVKTASSLDGGSALENGVSQWITSPAARRDVQYQRARASAILTSAATLQRDEARMNLRLGADGQQVPLRHPVRVVVDSQLRLGGDEKIFATEGEIWIYTCVEQADRQSRLTARGAEVIVMDADANGRLPLAAVLEDLAARAINEVFTECGAGLAGALIRAGLADRILLYLAPHLLGARARGLFDLGELTAMEQRVECALSDLRQIGPDLRLCLDLKPE